jgi:hypothetical protein
MKRKPGDLPGRYVPPHIRKWPNRPCEYVNVAEYQEHVEPPPSRLQPVAQQGELDLVTEPEQEQKPNPPPNGTENGRATIPNP